jgi:excisionase family DNA binding protein
MAAQKAATQAAAYTVGEAATALHCDESFLRRAINQRLIRSFRIGRAIRIAAREIERVQSEGLSKVMAKRTPR